MPISFSFQSLKQTIHSQVNITQIFLLSKIHFLFYSESGLFDFSFLHLSLILVLGRHTQELMIFHENLSKLMFHHDKF